MRLRLDGSKLDGNVVTYHVSKKAWKFKILHGLYRSAPHRLTIAPTDSLIVRYLVFNNDNNREPRTVVTIIRTMYDKEMSITQVHQLIGE